MSEHIVENNPKKEFLFALGGVALFLGIVLLIGISGFLRPAGEHITAETTKESAATDEAKAVAVEDGASAKTDSAAASVGAGADTTAPATAADATVTPTEDTSGAVVAAEAGTASASGTVNQAAVGDADLTAEQADGDLDAGNTKETATAE